VHISKYFLIGAVGACVDLAFFSTLIYGIDIHYLIAGAISFVFSTLVNYHLGIRFLFKKNTRFSSTKEMALIYIVSGLGLTFHQLILYTAVSHMGIQLILAKIITMGIVFFWNYSVRTYYIFAEREAS
jgi:putative flippase GtrA